MSERERWKLSRAVFLSAEFCAAITETKIQSSAKNEPPHVSWKPPVAAELYKAKKKDGLYTDRKYVKLAGHAAYTGILLALDEVYEKKGKGRKDIDWYKENLSKNHKKLFEFRYFTLCFITMLCVIQYYNNAKWRDLYAFIFNHFNIAASLLFNVITIGVFICFPFNNSFFQFSLINGPGTSTYTFVLYRWSMGLNFSAMAIDAHVLPDPVPWNTKTPLYGVSGLMKLLKNDCCSCKANFLVHTLSL